MKGSLRDVIECWIPARRAEQHFSGNSKEKSVSVEKLPLPVTYRWTLAAWVELVCGEVHWLFRRRSHLANNMKGCDQVSSALTFITTLEAYRMF